MKSKVIKIGLQIATFVISITTIVIAGYDRINCRARSMNARTIRTKYDYYKNFYSNREDIFNTNFSNPDIKNKISSLKTITDLFGDDITINSYNDKLNAFKLNKDNSIKSLVDIKWDAMYLIDNQKLFKNETKYSDDIVSMCYFIYNMRFDHYASFNDESRIASLLAGGIALLCSGAVVGFNLNTITSLKKK